MNFIFIHKILCYQVQKVILYSKTGLKRSFLRFLISKNKSEPEYIFCHSKSESDLFLYTCIFKANDSNRFLHANFFLIGLA